MGDDGRGGASSATAMVAAGREDEVARVRVYSRHPFIKEEEGSAEHETTRDGRLAGGHAAIELYRSAEEGEKGIFHFPSNFYFNFLAELIIMVK